METYCLKCREKRQVQNPEPVTMKNGRPATRGTCGTCGTSVFKIGKSLTGSAVRLDKRPTVREDANGNPLPQNRAPTGDGAPHLAPPVPRPTLPPRRSPFGLPPAAHQQGNGMG